MDKHLDLTNFYNHNKMLKDASEGEKIINNTDFKKYALQRKLKQICYQIGEIVTCKNGQTYKITGYDDDVLTVRPLTHYTKDGKIKKHFLNNEQFLNPCHII